MNKNKTYLILINGYESSGVEGIIARYIENKMKSTRTSCGGSPQKNLLIDGDSITIILLSYPKHFFSSIPDPYLSCDGFMSIYDITSRESFEKSKAEVEYVFERRWNKEMKIILVGSKCDLEIKRKVSFEEAHSFSQSKEALFIETSALCSINIDEAFFLLAREMIRAEKVKSMQIKPIEVNQPQQSTRSSWCY